MKHLKMILAAANLLAFAALLTFSACGGESEQEKLDRQIEVEALNLEIKRLEYQNMLREENKIFEDSLKEARK